MTDELPSYKKFEMANVAMSFLENGEHELADLALNEVKFGSDMKLFMEKSGYFTANPDVRKKAIEDAVSIFSYEYNSSLQNEKIKSLFDFYNKSIDYLPKEKQDRVQNLYNELGDSSLTDILKKYNPAAKLLDMYKKEKDGPLKDKFSEDEIKSAQKIVEKYSPFMQINMALDSYKLNGLRNSIVTKAQKRGIESLVDSLPEVKKPEEKKQ